MNNVIYFCDFPYNESNPAFQRVLNISKSLSDLGYIVTIYLTSIDENNSYYHNNLFNIQINTMEFNNKKSVLLNRLGFSSKIYKNIIKKEKPKYVFIYNYPSLPSFYLNQIKKKFGFKLISDITEWYQPKSIFKFIDVFLRMNIINFKVDGLICISYYLYNFYKKSKTNITIIPPLVSQFLKPKNIVSPYSKINLIYTGNPGTHKDRLDYLVNVFYKNDFSNFYNLSIIGITKFEFLSLYKNFKIKDNSKFDQIISFYGRLSHNQTLVKLSQSDFQVIFRESKRVNNAGFPTKLVQSFSSSCSVISTNISDINKYVKNGDNGFIIKFTDADLLNILNQIKDIDRNQIQTIKYNSYVTSRKFYYKNYNNMLKEFLFSLIFDSIN